MLSLDLFDSKFEKPLHEGAVDDAEYARLKKLGEKIDYLKQARAKATDPEMRRAIDNRIEQYHSERMEILSVRGMKEAEQPQRAPAKGLLKGKDLVTPQQRVAGATPQKPGIRGAVKDVVGGIKRFVKGEPDQGPTFEQETPDKAPGQPFELSMVEPTSNAQAIYQQLKQAYKAEAPSTIIPFIGEEDPQKQYTTLSKNAIYNALVAITQIQQKNRDKYIEKNFANYDSFINFVGRLKPYQYRRPPKSYRIQPQAPVEPTVSPNPQTAPGGPIHDPQFQRAAGIAPPEPKKSWNPFGDLNERKTQKKKSNDGSVLDVKLNREIQKARTKFPTAQSDLEALSLDQMTVNDQQDSVIQNLEKELNTVQDQNRTLSQTVQNMNTKVSQLSAPRAEPAVAQPVAPAEKPSKTAPTISITTREPEKAPVPADAKDAKAREEIAQLNKQIKQLELMMTLKQQPEQQADLQNKIEKLSATVIDLQAERQARIEKQQRAAEKAAATRAKKKAAQDEVDALIGRVKKQAGARQASTAQVEEHGGGIGPRQHWQSMMRNEQTHDASGGKMYQAKEKFLVRHNGKDIAFFPDIEQAKTAAKEMQQDLKGFATVHRVMREGEMSKIDIMRQDLKLMSDLQFMRAHGMSKAAFQQKYRTLLKPASQQDVPMEGTAQQFGQAIRMAGYSGRELEKDPAYKKDVQHARQEREQSQRNIARTQAGYGEEPDEYHDLDEMFNMPGTTVPHKSVIQGYTVFFNPKTKIVSVTRGGDSEEAAIEQARIGTVNLRTFRHTAERLIDKIESEDQLINEGIKDAAGATAVIACLLTGGSLTGCATAPQQTSAQQVLKTGQDVGRTVQTAKNITRSSVEAEVNQEIRNLANGIGLRPEELNNSNVLRIWRKLRGAPPVPPEPQAPEYGPAEPVKRMPQYEAKEPTTKQEYDRAVDSLMSQLKFERDSAVIQMLRAQLKVLQNKGQAHGWHKDTIIREDTAALAAEYAILKRIFVKHRDLMMEYGPDKITQAAEAVSYNVGDIAHITDEQITEWIGQVEQILGARP